MSLRTDPDQLRALERSAALSFSSAVAAMLAAIAASGSAARLLIARYPSTPDPRFPTHYAAGTTLPFPVIMNHDRGWLFLAVFAALVAVLGILSLIAVRCLRDSGAAAPALLLCGIGAVWLAMSLFPMTFSLDGYAYVAFGRLLGVDHRNPYVERLVGGSTFGDPMLSQLTAFLGTPLPDENYGPLWTLIAGAVGAATRNASLAAAVWMQRLVGGIALLAASVALLRMLRSRPAAERASRTALFGLHPLALYESGAAGHNDMLMIAPALWSFALVDASPLAAGLLAGAAIAVKYAAFIALPFLTIRAARRRGWAAAIALLLGACAVPIAAFVPLWPGWSTFGGLLRLQQTVIMSPMWLAQMWLPSTWSMPIAWSFAAVAAVVIVLALVRYAADLRPRHVFAGVAALLWTSPLLNPWYVQWLLPAAASAGRWARYAWLLGVIALARYVEDAPRFPSNARDLSARIAILEWATVAIIAVPLLLTFAGSRFARKGSPAEPANPTP